MDRHLLLAYDFPPVGGGIARWMGELARRYPAGRLVVSTAEQPGAAAADAALGIPVVRVPRPLRELRRLPGIVTWTRLVSSLVRARDVRFVWCGNLRPVVYAARWARLRSGTPYGVILHGHDLLLLRNRIARSRLKRRQMREIFDAAAVLVTNSHFTADLCRSVMDDLGAAAARRVRAVPLGTDPVFFRPGADPAPLLARHGLPAGRRWLVTVARLKPHKGIDTVIRALAALSGREPALHYAVAGSGDQHDELEALAGELGVAGRVHLLGNVPDAELPALHALADVYVQASRRTPKHVEGFGIAAVEAAACGRPVVAGRSGGLAEAVRDGETGLLVDPERPEAVAEAVARLLDDRELAARLGAAGRRSVEDHFNWDRVTAELVALADGIAREHRRPAA